MGAEWIAIILTTVSLISIGIGAWTTINVKIKELDIKIMAVEQRLQVVKDDVKQDRCEIISTIEKNNDKIWEKLEKIMDFLMKQQQNKE